MRLRRHVVRWAWQEVSWPRPLGWTTVQGLMERITADPVLGHVVFETRATNAGVTYRVGAHPHHLTTVTSLLTDLIPDLRAATPKATRAMVQRAGVVSITHPQAVLDTSKAEAIARAVHAAMNGLHPSEILLTQLHIGGRVPPHDHTTSSGSWLETIMGIHHPAPRNSRSSHPAGRHMAKVCLRIGATAATPGRAKVIIMNLFGGLRVAETAGIRLRISEENPHLLNTASTPRRYRLRLSAPEIASLANLPIGAGNLPALPPLAPRIIPAPSWWTPLSAGSRVFGVDATNPRLPIGIPATDACLHTILLGATGAGKSTAMQHLIISDINAGRSVVVIDPKGDLVADIADRIPAHRLNDVIIIDPTNPAPVGLNPLAHTNTTTDLVPDVLLATFKTLFADSWGVRSEEILTACLHTLTQTRLPEAKTLVAIPSLLTNPSFRARVLASVHDRLGTDRFWAKYQALSDHERTTHIAPVLNKLQQLIIRPRMRAILGQTQPQFALSEIFTTPRILLVPLNKGTIGPESARLLGSLLIGQLWPLILSRATTPAAQRHLVSIYVDEVHDYLASVPGDLADALAQSRSLGVAWHLAHQYRTQLTGSMKAAIDTNCHHKIYFGLGPADAADVTRHDPTLTPADFTTLPRYTAYTNLTTTGRQTGWITTRTLPPAPALATSADTHALSTTRYGTPAETTEQTLITITGQQPNTPPPTATATRTQNQTPADPPPPPAEEIPSQPDQPNTTAPSTNANGHAMTGSDHTTPVFGKRRKPST